MHISEQGFGELSQLISDALFHSAITHEHLKITTINEGAINRNFCVWATTKTVLDDKRAEVSEKRFLAKFFANNEKLPVNRRRQFRLQASLSKQGLAPKPIFLSEDQTVYIEEWVPALNSLGTEKQQITIAYLATLLNKIHSTTLDLTHLHQLDLSADWQHYMAFIFDDCYLHLNKEEKENLRQEHKDILPVLDAYQHEHQHDLVLCHHDLHLSHVSGNHSICFDWEYAAASSRYFDLACTIKSNEFSATQSNSLIETYAAASGLEVSVIKKCTGNAMELVNFTNKLWWLLTKDTNG